MMPNAMRQQAMGGPNPNAQMNMNAGGGMGMGSMGGMSRGFGMNEQGHMGHMGPMGGSSMYGGSGGGGSGGGGMGSRMMQMNQMGQMNQAGHMNQMNQMGPMNHPGQAMQQHPQQPPFQSSGGFGLSGMNSPSGSPRMGGPQQGLLMSPRNRGSPKMGANQFSPGGKSVSQFSISSLTLLFNLINLNYIFLPRHTLSHEWHCQWWGKWGEYHHLLKQLLKRPASNQ